MAATAAGAGVPGAQGSGAIGNEVFQDAIFDQQGALGGHPLIVHVDCAKGIVRESFVPGGEVFVGNFFALAVLEGGGAALNLGGFQQVAAGFMENHTAKGIGHHDRVGARFHIVGVEHFPGGFRNFRRHVAIVPGAQEVGAAGVAGAFGDRGTVGPVSTQQVIAHGLGEADVAGEGAIAGSDQDFLPVAEVGGAARLDVAGLLAQAVGGTEQHVTHFAHGTAFAQPQVFVAQGGIVAQQVEVNFGDVGGGAGQSQPQDRQGFFQGVAQTAKGDIVGADVAVGFAQKQAHSGPEGQTGRNAGDRVVFGEAANVVDPL